MRTPILPSRLSQTYCPLTLVTVATWIFSGDSGLTASSFMASLKLWSHCSWQKNRQGKYIHVKAIPPYIYTHIFHRYRTQFYIYVFPFGKREKSHSKPPAYNSTHTVDTWYHHWHLIMLSVSGKNSIPTFCHMTGRCCDEYICDGME